MNASVEAHEHIDNYSLVFEMCGRWPSFHDGEVQRLVLDSTRRDAYGDRYSSIELVVRGWNKLADAAEWDSVVHFLFEDVTDVELDGLNHQNVLSGLEFEIDLANGDGSPLLSVELCHCYGLSGAFKARRAKVLSVTPYLG